jgi:hypothetical protein
MAERMVTYIHTYLLTLYSTVLLEKLTGLHLVKKFPVFYGTRRFITAFTSARPTVSILSQLNPVHTLTSNYLKINLNIILSSTPESPQLILSLWLPNKNPVHDSLLPHMRYMPCPSHSQKFNNSLQLL